MSNTISTQTKNVEHNFNSLKNLKSSNKVTISTNTISVDSNVIDNIDGLYDSSNTDTNDLSVQNVQVTSDFFNQSQSIVLTQQSLVTSNTTNSITSTNVTSIVPSIGTTVTGTPSTTTSIGVPSTTTTTSVTSIATSIGTMSSGNTSSTTSTTTSSTQKDYHENKLYKDEAIVIGSIGKNLLNDWKNTKIGNPLTRSGVFGKNLAIDYMNENEWTNNLAEKEQRQFIKMMTDDYVRQYNQEMSAVNAIDKKALELGKAMDREIALANGDQTQIANIEQKYQPEFDALEEKRIEHLSKISPTGDGKDLKSEKMYFGNSQSEMISYGSQSIWTAALSFGMKEITGAVTTYASAIASGYDIKEALGMARDALGGENLKKNATEAGAQGIGNFFGLVLSKGDINSGFAGGTVASNIASFTYSYFNAGSEEAKKQVIHEKFGDMLLGSTGAVVSLNFSMFSVNSGNIIGKDINQVYNWFRDYEDFADFAANVSAAEVSSKILGLTGAVIGDLLEYNFTGKNLGLLSTVFNPIGEFMGNYTGELGENIGYWYYDYSEAAKDFGGCVFDTCATYVEWWNIGFEEIKGIFEKKS